MCVVGEGGLCRRWQCGPSAGAAGCNAAPAVLLGPRDGKLRCSEDAASAMERLDQGRLLDLRWVWARAGLPGEGRVSGASGAGAGRPCLIGKA